MSACRHRPEEGCLFRPCVDVTRDEAGKRVCLCASELRDEMKADDEGTAA